MDGKTSIKELHFGFLDGSNKVVSNVPNPRLEDLLKLAVELDRSERNFLKPCGNLVILDINEQYQDYLLNQIFDLFPEFSSEAVYRERDANYFIHHAQTGKIKGYDALNDSSPIRSIYGRTKDIGSALEKVTRKAVSLKSIACKLLPGLHVNIADAYAYKIVVKDEETRDIVREKFRGSPKFSLIESEARRKANGYNAVHEVYMWNRNSIPNAALEVQIVTEAERLVNNYGRSTNHTRYSAGKLEKPRQLEGLQSVVFNKSDEGRLLTPRRFRSPFAADAIVINY